jgi:hypothetical protein
VRRRGWGCRPVGGGEPPELLVGGVPPEPDRTRTVVTSVVANQIMTVNEQEIKSFD